MKEYKLALNILCPSPAEVTLFHSPASPLVRLCMRRYNEENLHLLHEAWGVEGDMELPLCTTHVHAYVLSSLSIVATRYVIKMP